MKGIIVTGSYFSYDKNLNQKSCEDQIKIMVELHKLLANCKFNNLNRFGSIIGKEIEDYKVQLKKIKKDYQLIMDKSYKNDVDKLLISEGKRMISQGAHAIEYIYDNGYIEIIERCMNREEICIGRADRGNLRKNNDIFEIGVIKGMTYNLVEEDLYKYIKRLQKKGIGIDEDYIIKTFVHQSHLSFNSINYLRGLCSYPRDFFRNWEKYRQNKKNKSDQEFLENITKSLKYEYKSFII